MKRIRIIGLDWFDVVVHVGATIAVAVVGATLFNGQEGDIAVSVVLGSSLVLLGWRRQRALAAMREMPTDPGRADELEVRVAELEQLHDRVAELEERLDFAERMLARQKEQEQLSPGGR
ncbi:MAG TPA: hypothetical protein VJN95_11745 [Gemmatimonadales bacterium]|nr:hypothetical protein [Gemmatimonadales bacterium]